MGYDTRQRRVHETVLYTVGTSLCEQEFRPTSPTIKGVRFSPYLNEMVIPDESL